MWSGNFPKYRLSYAGRPETAGTPFRFRQNGPFFKNRPAYGADYKLGDTVAVPYPEGFLTQIDQKNLQLPPVIRINGSGGI
jgi:hypothetical protein